MSEVADKQKQQELTLHFLLLGGLRYNQEDLLELIGRTRMIPLEELKESSFYKFIVEEGMKEGREKGLQERLQEGLQQGLQQGKVETAAEMLLMLVAKRFPGLDVATEIERIRDAAVLQQLCLEVIDMPDAAALEKRLAEIIKQSESNS